VAVRTKLPAPAAIEAVEPLALILGLQPFVVVDEVQKLATELEQPEDAVVILRSHWIRSPMSPPARSAIASSHGPFGLNGQPDQ